MPGGTVCHCLSFRKTESVCVCIVTWHKWKCKVWLFYHCFLHASIMISPVHLIHYWCYYCELVPAQFESYFHFAQNKKNKKRASVSRRYLCLFVEIVFAVVGNSPAASSITMLSSGDCLRSPAISWVVPDDTVVYVRTAHKENTFKVRLKLEPFHHEALWEVLCIWGGNKYCQIRAKHSQYTALACVIFRAGIYHGLVPFCSAV